jgi:transcriptional accessory protein Tex/SPT6
MEVYYIWPPLAERELSPQVGMYQKDLKASALKAACADSIESCVHWAGVDLNTASVELLQPGRNRYGVQGFT